MKYGETRLSEKGFYRNAFFLKAIDRYRFFFLISSTSAVETASFAPEAIFRRAVGEYKERVIESDVIWV